MLLGLEVYDLWGPFQPKDAGFCFYCLIFSPLLLSAKKCQHRLDLSRLSLFFPLLHVIKSFMLNEYWQACNYAKLLKHAVTTPCLLAFLQQVFFNSSLQSLHHLCHLLLDAFQYFHVCCPVELRYRCSFICFMCGHPQCWIGGKDHHFCWQYLAAQGTIVPTRAHCWCMFSLVSTETPRYFSAKLLSR